MAIKRRYKNGSQIKKSREDLKEGPLGVIWLKFFKPLIDDIREEFEDSETAAYAIDMLFAGRAITCYRLKRDINAVGQKVHWSTTLLNNSVGADILERDSRVWVRTDFTKNFVDLEKEDETVYRMSTKQFKEIERYLSMEQ